MNWKTLAIIVASSAGAVVFSADERVVYEPTISSIEDVFKAGRTRIGLSKDSEISQSTTTRHSNGYRREFVCMLEATTFHACVGLWLRFGLLIAVNVWYLLGLHRLCAVNLNNLKYAFLMQRLSTNELKLSGSLTNRIPIFMFEVQRSAIATIQG